MIRQSLVPAMLRVGALLALLAVAVQLGAGSVVPASRPGGGLERLLATSICHSHAADPGTAPTEHQTPACTACPLCQAVHLGLLLAMPGFAFVAPVLAVLRAPPVQPRAPPSALNAATSARGPPVPI